MPESKVLKRLDFHTTFGVEEVVFSYTHTILGGSGREGQAEALDFPGNVSSTIPGKPDDSVPLGLSTLRFGGLHLRNDPTWWELIAYAKAQDVHDH